MNMCTILQVESIVFGDDAASSKSGPAAFPLAEALHASMHYVTGPLVRQLADRQDHAVRRVHAHLTLLMCLL